MKIGIIGGGDRVRARDGDAAPPVGPPHGRPRDADVQLPDRALRRA